MVFSRHLLDGIRRGRITFSIRIWTRPHVKVGGRYPVGEGHIVVDAITPLELGDITDALARESGFKTAQDLLETAKHGKGDNVYLIRFHYLRPGAWDQTDAPPAPASPSRTLLQRIRNVPPARVRGDAPARASRRRGH